MEISQRLDILLESGVITKEVYYKLIRTVDELKAKHGIEINEENGGMFITHLSAAITRMDKGEPIESLDEIIIEQVKQDKNYGEAMKIMKTLNSVIDIEFPLEEETFIVTHLCSILN
ncbi:PRD domain-containing protein [Clostridium cavendishii DSM 21758]|uniref:PRD domain-containing protein n=1 Tax=Clostridium cavendishii DSM 21758 TaxID=1121302 RepID=A0A1M6GSC8_9CLOT|nr:PRD domain-containing protein [Clostridium cavendishii]SHJ12895.1 PRD domain-containing protein [Clostridium cavendishii DSM 21758]